MNDIDKILMLYKMEKEGQPPKPGLVFDRSKHRWVKPKLPKTEHVSNLNSAVSKYKLAHSKVGRLRDELGEAANKHKSERKKILDDMDNLPDIRTEKEKLDKLGKETERILYTQDGKKRRYDLIDQDRLKDNRKKVMEVAEVLSRLEEKHLPKYKKKLDGVDNKYLPIINKLRDQVGLCVTDELKPAAEEVKRYGKKIGVTTRVGLGGEIKVTGGENKHLIPNEIQSPHWV